MNYNNNQQSPDGDNSSRIIALYNEYGNGPKLNRTVNVRNQQSKYLPVPDQIEQDYEHRPNSFIQSSISQKYDPDVFGNYNAPVLIKQNLVDFNQVLIPPTGADNNFLILVQPGDENQVIRVSVRRAGKYYWAFNIKYASDMTDVSIYQSSLFISGQLVFKSDTRNLLNTVVNGILQAIKWSSVPATVVTETFTQQQTLATPCGVVTSVEFDKGIVVQAIGRSDEPFNITTGTTVAGRTVPLTTYQPRRAAAITYVYDYSNTVNPPEFTVSQANNVQTIRFFVNTATSQLAGFQNLMGRIQVSVNYYHMCSVAPTVTSFYNIKLGAPWTDQLGNFYDTVDLATSIPTNFTASTPASLFTTTADCTYENLMNIPLQSVEATFLNQPVFTGASKVRLEVTIRQVSQQNLPSQETIGVYVSQGDQVVFSISGYLNNSFLPGFQLKPNVQPSFVLRHHVREMELARAVFDWYKTMGGWDGLGTISDANEVFSYMNDCCQQMGQPHVLEQAVNWAKLKRIGRKAYNFFEPLIEKRYPVIHRSLQPFMQQAVGFPSHLITHTRDLTKDGDVEANPGPGIEIQLHLKEAGRKASEQEADRQSIQYNLEKLKDLHVDREPALQTLAILLFKKLRPNDAKDAWEASKNQSLATLMDKIHFLKGVKTQMDIYSYVDYIASELHLAPAEAINLVAHPMHAMAIVFDMMRDEKYDDHFVRYTQHGFRTSLKDRGLHQLIPSIAVSDPDFGDHFDRLVARRGEDPYIKGQKLMWSGRDMEYDDGPYDSGPPEPSYNPANVHVNGLLANVNIKKPWQIEHSDSSSVSEIQDSQRSGKRLSTVQEESHAPDQWQFIPERTRNPDDRGVFVRKYTPRAPHGAAIDYRMDPRHHSDTRHPRFSDLFQQADTPSSHGSKRAPSPVTQERSSIINEALGDKALLKQLIKGDAQHIHDQSAPSPGEHKVAITGGTQLVQTEQPQASHPISLMALNPQPLEIEHRELNLNPPGQQITKGPEVPDEITIPFNPDLFGQPQTNSANLIIETKRPTQKKRGPPTEMVDTKVTTNTEDIGDTTTTTAQSTDFSGFMATLRVNVNLQENVVAFMKAMVAQSNEMGGSLEADYLSNPEPGFATAFTKADQAYKCADLTLWNDTLADYAEYYTSARPKDGIKTKACYTLPAVNTDGKKVGGALAQVVITYEAVPKAEKDELILISQMARPDGSVYWYTCNESTFNDQLDYWQQWSTAGRQQGMVQVNGQQMTTEQRQCMVFQFMNLKYASWYRSKKILAETRGVLTAYVNIPAGQSKVIPTGESNCMAITAGVFGCFPGLLYGGVLRSTEIYVPIDSKDAKKARKAQQSAGWSIEMVADCPAGPSVADLIVKAWTAFKAGRPLVYAHPGKLLLQVECFTQEKALGHLSDSIRKTLGFDVSGDKSAAANPTRIFPAPIFEAGQVTVNRMLPGTVVLVQDLNFSWDKLTTQIQGGSSITTITNKVYDQIKAYAQAKLADLPPDSPEREKIFKDLLVGYLWLCRNNNQLSDFDDGVAFTNVVKTFVRDPTISGLTMDDLYALYPYTQIPNIKPLQKATEASVVTAYLPNVEIDTAVAKKNLYKIHFANTEGYITAKETESVLLKRWQRHKQELEDAIREGRKARFTIQDQQAMSQADYAGHESVIPTNYDDRNVDDLRNVLLNADKDELKSYVARKKKIILGSNLGLSAKQIALVQAITEDDPKNWSDTAQFQKLETYYKNLVARVNSQGPKDPVPLVKWNSGKGVAGSEADFTGIINKILGLHAMEQNMIAASKKKDGKKVEIADNFRLQDQKHPIQMRPTKDTNAAPVNWSEDLNDEYLKQTQARKNVKGQPWNKINQSVQWPAQLIARGYTTLHDCLEIRQTVKGSLTQQDITQVVQRFKEVYGPLIEAEEEENNVSQDTFGVTKPVETVIIDTTQAAEGSSDDE